ncbi:MAG: YoaK family protein [Acetobacteraceae bacterium]|nr:YoaK family protein [Acetobacteraceae bacterium]
MKERRPIGYGLMLMSFGSGCMDILSYRFLGEVFPSAMTGNVAFMGLSLGQGDLSAASRNASAFASFFGGLLIGGVLLRGTPGRWRFVLTLALQSAALLAFVLLWGRHADPAWRYGLIGLAAVAMGLQSAVAHRIGLSGVSTTYFTGTLTNIAFGLVAPAALDRSKHPALRRVGWPLLAFLSYLGGAATGGWYIAGRNLPDLPVGLPALPLAATVILAIIIIAAAPARESAVA